ncbi:hypothetical protein [Acutalibacter sp. 1XD8-36]|uniref:hypothetical protein n=1 Tax=Acutalibacter sp. 1XD8-36 TaxID=2320852 RepID=UPI001412C948|nr:hypothetical protein [Acutalibacter sp. 1XD8-36]NBJ88666.1 hypothetical protein [Acutalibacter sp. 1XD8-36]
MQNEFLVRLEMKKALNRRKLLLAIPIAMLICAVVSNLNEMGSASYSAAQMKVQADNTCSQLDEARQDYEETLSLIDEKKGYLASCQKEIAAMPTSSPEDMVKVYDMDVTYEQLKRSPSEYIGKKLAFLGTVGFESVSSWNRISSDYPGRMFGLYINGLAGESILVHYNDDGGRVVNGDVVIVYATATEDPQGDIILIADSIALPSEDKIQDWIIDRAYGDSPRGDELRDALGQWQKGLEEITGQP